MVRKTKPKYSDFSMGDCPSEGAGPFSTLDAQQTLGALITTLTIFVEDEKALRSAKTSN
jgi:hypothetical protein